MTSPTKFLPPDPIATDLRKAWMLREEITFLNHGSFGGVPRAVFDVQSEWRHKIEAEPIEILARLGPGLIAKSKQAVAKFLHVRPADFGLVTNATDGVNAVLRSLHLKPGDELLTTDHVYGAVWQSMQCAADRTGATLRKIAIPLPVTSADEIAAIILDGLSQKTRLLLIDHITSPTALVFPVRQIIEGCEQRGVDVLVDGAHAPGMVELDITALSPAYYCGNLHKWVCAPKGSGVLWVRPDRQANVHPLVVSHDFGQGFAKEFDWQGTRDISGWLTLPGALEYMGAFGWDRIRSHNHALACWAHELLCDRLGVEPISPRDGTLLGSMAAFPAPAWMSGMSDEEGRLFQERLYSEHRIEVPLMRWNGRWLLRVSCQIYNQTSDYERLAQVLTLAR